MANLSFAGSCREGNLGYTEQNFYMRLFGRISIGFPDAFITYLIDYTIPSKVYVDKVIIYFSC